MSQNLQSVSALYLIFPFCHQIAETHFNEALHPWTNDAFPLCSAGFSGPSQSPKFNYHHKLKYIFILASSSK